jgi:hypothetical protein
MTHIVGSVMSRHVGEPTNERADMSGAVRDAVNADPAT